MDTAALKNQAMALGRGGVYFLAGVAVGKGWLQGETAFQIAGAVLTVVGGALTVSANTNSSIVQAASQVPEIKRMDIASPDLAKAARTADPTTEVKVVP